MVSIIGYIYMYSCIPQVLLTMAPRNRGQFSSVSVGGISNIVYASIYMPCVVIFCPWS